MPEYADVPAPVVASIAAICLGLPEVYQEQAWTGQRWRVRKRTFAHVLTIDSPRGEATVLTFRSVGDELDALKAAGHPFFLLGWGRDVMGMVIDDDVDWDEVRELLTESYCVMAPQKLIALVDRPD